MGVFFDCLRLGTVLVLGGYFQRLSHKFIFWFVCESLSEQVHFGAIVVRIMFGNGVIVHCWHGYHVQIVVHQQGFRFIIRYLVSVLRKTSFIHQQVAQVLSVLNRLFRVVNFGMRFVRLCIVSKLYLVETVTEPEVRQVGSLNHAHNFIEAVRPLVSLVKSCNWNESAEGIGVNELFEGDSKFEFRVEHDLIKDLFKFPPFDLVISKRFFWSEIEIHL